MEDPVADTGRGPASRLARLRRLTPVHGGFRGQVRPRDFLPAVLGVAALGVLMLMELDVLLFLVASGALLAVLLERNARFLARVGTRRRCTQQTVTENAARQLVDQVPAMIWLTDAEGCCTFLNRRWGERTGIAPDQGLGGGWREWVHIEDRPRTEAIFSEAQVRREPFSLDHRLYRGDGTYGWVTASGVPRFDADGGFLGYIGSVLDVSERKEAEAACRASESALRRHLEEIEFIYATAPVALCVLDRELRFVRVNERLAELTGVPVQAHLGRTLRETVPGMAAEAEPLMRHVLQTGRPLLNQEIRGEMPAQPGVAKICVQSLLPLRSEAGEIVAVNVVAEDVTERRRVEAALRESEQRFRRLAEALPQIVYTTGPDGRGDWVNSHWYEYVGECAGDASDWASRLHPEEAQQVLARWEHCVATGTPFRMEHRTRKADGSYGWHLSQAMPVTDEQGAILKWVGAYADISETKRAEQALEEARRRKDQFIATLSHELRNPLSPISSCVETMRRIASDTPQLIYVRQVIDRQVKHMARLVDDLLDISRISQGKVDLRNERVELSAILEHGVENVLPLIQARGHELSVSGPPHAVWLSGDAIRLAQVISNLLENAAKYTVENGRIRLCVELEERQVLIRVADNGAGIAPDLLPFVFDMFTQAERGLDRNQGGLGVGLTLVKKLVELHGGTVEARSAGPGQGSEFTVRLPTVASFRKAEQPAAPECAAAGAVSSARILVVDDLVDAAESMAMMLVLEGHEVRTAHDGPAALEVAQAFRPRVLLLDIGLPGMDGYELARRVRSLPGFEDALLIAITGYGQAEDRDRARAAGFDHHLVKPVDASTLYGLLGGTAHTAGLAATGEPGTSPVAFEPAEAMRTIH